MRHISLAISVYRTSNRRLLQNVEFSKRMQLYRNVLAEKSESTIEDEKEIMKRKSIISLPVFHNYLNNKALSNQLYCIDHRIPHCYRMEEMIEI